MTSSNNDISKFWELKSLYEMSNDEWEQLCDGCAKCCLHKLEDEDTGTVYYTNIACRMLDLSTCRCKDYVRRTTLIRDCVEIRPDSLGVLDSMPPGCAYRLIYEGKPLPDWHHLISGDRQSIHKAGKSVLGRTVDEQDVEDYEDQIVDWPIDD